MKKVLFASAVSLFFLLSCKDDASNSGNASGDKAKANNRAILKDIESGDVSKLDTYITKDAVDHNGMGGTEVKGVDNIKKDLGTMKQDFSDFKIDVMQEATNGDYLFVLGKMSGTTSAKPGNGMPPNQKVEMTSVDVLKFNSDGMFTDHWSFNDPHDMMKMMGGDKKMDNKMDNKMAPQDTTKK